MLTSRNSRLFRFLLSLVVRLRLPAGRIAVALRSWFASLWSSILTFVRHRGQPQIRLHANDVPVVGNPTGEQVGPQTSERATNVEEVHSGTLAALPVRHTLCWQDEVSRYQAPTSSRQLEFHPLPATPEAGSQRYMRRTVQ